MKLNAQQRILTIIRLMAENGYKGVKNTDLVLAIGTSAAVISRDLALLREEGWAERRPDGRTRLSPEFAAISHRIAASLRDARLELQKEEALYIDAMGGSHV